MTDIYTLREQIKDIQIVMLTTVDEDGTLRSRPMGTTEVALDGDLWFFTADPSGKTAEIRRDQQVNLSYVDSDANRYVSVSGSASISHDRAKMEKYWKPSLRMWFPDGLETPDIALLRVRIEKAEYWDYPSGRLVQLVGFVKAIASGDGGEGEGGTHEKLTIR